MKSINKPFFICVLSLILSNFANAEVNSLLQDYFAQRISQVQNTMVLSPTDSSPDSMFILQNINLDFSPTVTFGISHIISLAISPEIDFVFVPTDPSSTKDDQ